MRIQVLFHELYNCGQDVILEGKGDGGSLVEGEYFSYSNNAMVLFQNILIVEHSGQVSKHMGVVLELDETELRHRYF
jgi:hypothetical protein